jgi:hypothetical protein
MKYFTTTVILLFCSTLIAQPGGGGGLQIMNLYGYDSLQKDTSLKIQHFILSKKKHKVIEEFLLSQEDVSYYHFYQKELTYIYLPPYIRKGSKSIKVPNQRLQIIYKGDTMIIDFIDVFPENPSGNTDRIDKIFFVAGYFKWFRDPSKTIASFWSNPKTTEKQRNDIQYRLNRNLDNTTIPELQSLGLLIFKPNLVVRERVMIELHQCFDTAYSWNFGFHNLCYDKISDNGEYMDINTIAMPISEDSLVSYKFIYQNKYYPGEIYHVYKSRRLESDSMLLKLKTKKLMINGNVFTGRLLIATRFYLQTVQRYNGYNITTLTFKDGKLVDDIFIHDVDLGDITQRMER